MCVLLLEQQLAKVKKTEQDGVGQRWGQELRTSLNVPIALQLLDCVRGKEDKGFPTTGLCLLWQKPLLCSHPAPTEVRYKSLSSYQPVYKNKLRSSTLLKYYIQLRSLLFLSTPPAPPGTLTFHPLLSPIRLFQPSCTLSLSCSTCSHLLYLPNPSLNLQLLPKLRGFPASLPDAVVVHPTALFLC